MYIEREHYLDILQQIQQLSKENKILNYQNTIIARELEREKTINLELLQKFRHVQQQMGSLNNKVISQNEAIHCDLKGYMIKLDQQHKKLIEAKFHEIQNSSFQKYKVLEIKNRSNRLQNHEMSSFNQKITKIYHSVTGKAEDPSLKDLIKWVKNLVKTALNNQKNKSRQETGQSWRQMNQIRPNPH